MVLAMFDKMLATDDTQTVQRKMLLMKLGHAIDKHAYAEEHVVYPALREAMTAPTPRNWKTEHGEVKEFLYRLEHMDLDAPNWLETMREFRDGGRSSRQDGGRAGLSAAARRNRRRARCADHQGGQQGRLHDGLADQPTSASLGGSCAVQLDRALSEDPGQPGSKVGIKAEVAAKRSGSLPGPR